MEIPVFSAMDENVMRCSAYPGERAHQYQTAVQAAINALHISQ
jgi:hypothetical protein